MLKAATSNTVKYWNIDSYNLANVMADSGDFSRSVTKIYRMQHFLAAMPLVELPREYASQLL